MVSLKVKEPQIVTAYVTLCICHYDIPSSLSLYVVAGQRTLDYKRMDQWSLYAGVSLKVVREGLVVFVILQSHVLVSDTHNQC